MIYIQINRYIINQCEKAIDKYNASKEEHFARITNYSEIISKALEMYLKVR